MADQRVSTQIGNTHFTLMIEVPDDCPICHRSINVGISGPIVSTIPDGSQAISRLQVLFRCPRSKCDRLFLGVYEGTWKLGSPVPASSSWKSTLFPAVLAPREFDPIICRLSPEFVRIHEQAAVAEMHGLDRICGAGYRKSLEFLIKDFLKSVSPDDTEKIEATQVGPLINQYVSDPRLKIAASRATWLGNDETHYFRKWEEKDLNDLKKLIDVTIHWISMDVLTRDLEASMPASGPNPSGLIKVKGA